MSPFEPFGYIPLLGYVLGLALLTALLEVQIEGAHGWAAGLPTWRFGPPWLKRLLGGKDLTGYHVYLTLLLLALLHFAVLFTRWSLTFELTILSLYFTYAIMWDFLWFVLNPAFGVAAFRRSRVWWFQRWLGPFPADYYLYLVLAALLATARGLTSGARVDASLSGVPEALQHLLGWGAGVLLCAAAISVIVLVRRKQPVAVREVSTAAPVLQEPTVHDARATVDGGALIPTDDPLMDEIDEEERLERARWLVQFGEVIFGILLGLSIQSVASANLFSPTADRSFLDMAGTAAPLLILYGWIAFYIIIYWYNMRLETPLFAVIIRQRTGVPHLVLIVLLGFILFESFRVLTPQDFSTLARTDVSQRLDIVMRWLGVIIVFDFLAQAYIRSHWLRSTAVLATAEPFWNHLLPGVRRYYGYFFPAKTLGLLLVYFAVFFPGAGFLPSQMRFPLPRLVGLTDPLSIAIAFVAVNVLMEAYLAFQRTIVHQVATAFRLEQRRRQRQFATDAVTDKASPGLVIP